MKEIDCIIEIHTNSNQKLEIDYDYNRMRLDRMLSTSMGYPGNYGYIPNTLCDDGDAIDIIMPVDYSLPIGCVVKCKIIGVFIMEDDKGKDEKLIVLPADKVDPRYKDINDINDLPVMTLNKIEHFFQHYKDLSIKTLHNIDTKKEVKTNGFKNAKDALKYLENSYILYQKTYKNTSTHSDTKKTKKRTNKQQHI
jgi:inorganic pyrophosphatase